MEVEESLLDRTLRLLQTKPASHSLNRVARETSIPIHWYWGLLRYKNLRADIARLEKAAKYLEAVHASVYGATDPPIKSDASRGERC